MAPVAKKRRLSDSVSDQAISQQPSVPAIKHGRQSVDTATVLSDGESKSNDFRIKAEEMLSQVHLNYSKRVASVEKLLHGIKKTIDAIPEKLNQPIGDVEKEMKGKRATIPFPTSLGEVQYKFGYSKPTYMNVVGSYALQTAIKERNRPISIDLALVMPTSLFQEKDYLNYRYFHKRAYYLAEIATAIRDTTDGPKGLKLSYDYVNEDYLRPALLIEPGEEFSAAKCSIRIILAVSPEVFPLGKLLPSKNCVRPSNSDVSIVPEATPSYNASLVADTTPFSYLKLLHSSASSCAAFKKACILGRIWLRQRGFGGGACSHGGFGHFEWAVMMALLLQGGNVGGRPLLMRGYSHYQLFRATLQFLATRDLMAQPLWMNYEPLDDVKTATGPVFFDGERKLNLLFKMAQWDYKLLKHEAELALQALNNTAFDQFEAVFIWRIDAHCRFDALAHVPLSAELAAPSTVDAAPSATIYARKVYELLEQGMGDRALLISISQPALKPGSSINKYNPNKMGSHLQVGFILEPSHYRRVLDRGPPPEQKKHAAAFRKFWGDKAELRRFQDGSIVETVVWKDPIHQPVYEQITTYVLGRHLAHGVTEKINFSGSEFDRLLPKPASASALATADFQPAMESFDQLRKHLLTLEGLPLDIKRTYPVGPVLRYAAVQASRLMIEPADVVVEFEGSGKWPDDLIAIQKTKLAFLLKMAELLDRSESDAISRVGIENEDSQIMNGGFLDVVYPASQAAFRVRIFHDREALLLDRKITGPSTSPSQRDEAEEALKEYQRTFVRLPRHAQDMQKLSHHYPAFSPTVRLVKKWFSAQLLSPHIAEEAVEIIVARCFIYSAPWTSPSTVMSGFLRVLTFLALWDWRLDPLLVDLGNNMKRPDFERLEDAFRKARKSDPSMQRTPSMFIVSDQGAFTRAGQPMTVVAARITALAKSACEVVGSHKESPIPVMKLFVPSTREYDFLLHLDLKVAQRSQVGEKKRFKNLSNSVDETNVDFNPVQWFVEDIKRVYEDNIVLFHSESSDIIAGVWSLNTVAPRKWKVNLNYSTMVTEKSMMTLNRQSVLNEIARLGGELLQRIEVK